VPLRVASAAIVIETALGDITIELHDRAAPQSCGYVLGLVDREVLTPCSVFRIVTPSNDALSACAAIEVIQLGHRCANPDTAVIIAHESTALTGLRHVRGTVALPRYRPGATYESFFICLRDEPALDHGGKRNPDGLGFAAFGSVVSGWPAIDSIRARAEEHDYLVRPILVTRVRRAEP